MDAQIPVVVEDVQVAAKPRRRTYTAEYKRRILKEADAWTTAGGHWGSTAAGAQPPGLHANGYWGRSARWGGGDERERQ